MKNNLFITLIGLTVVLGSCNLINPVEKQPTYVRIDSFKFNISGQRNEGTASQKITSAFVFFNNQQVGVYDLPATIPVIADAKGELLVMPGVTYRGLSQYEIQYPFFTSYKTEIEARKGEVLKIAPESAYIPSARFQWIEDFDRGSTFVKVSESSEDTALIQTFDPGKIFEGSASGLISLTSTHRTSENITGNGFPITQGVSFLEINYKGTVPFTVGLQTTVGGEIRYSYLAGINPKDEWNKLYIDLEAFTAEHKGSEYRVMIKSTLPEGATEGYVLLDNLKVISY
jgi:hypothetical protein